MFPYLYTATYGIFLNTSIRIPSPLIFGLPIILIFWKKRQPFLYTREVIVFLIANLIYYGIALSSLQSVSVNSIILLVSILFFNFFIGYDYERFKVAVRIFYGLLAFSTLIMLLNHVNPGYIVPLRRRLLGSEIFQTPSGIASFIFGFGYQLATVVGFAFVYSIMYRKAWFIKIFALFCCLIAVYFGMQRSVLIAFAGSTTIFLFCYYKYKAIPIMALLVVISVAFSVFFISQNKSGYDNIFSKNERNSEEDRGNLMVENLNIYSDYPFGLMFYGKTWNDVTKYDTVYVGGITSHNAYLMFFTYLGPFIGITLLLLIYYKIGAIFKNAVINIKDHKYALLVCLCFSFIAVSMNSLFHNDWLLAANGPSLFTYFAILHLDNYIKHTDNNSEEVLVA